MVDDSVDTSVPLGNATATLQHDGERQRFRINTASLAPRGRHRAQITFQGPRGAVAVELPRVALWNLTQRFHEVSIASGFAAAK